MRSAFGFAGQKCSANSRVYVERPVMAEFNRLLVAKTEAITIGDPTDRANWLGPVIDQKAVDRYDQAASARRAGTAACSSAASGVTEDGLDKGFFVAPTIAVDLPTDHRLFLDELFLPFTVRCAGRLDRRGAAAFQRPPPRPDRRLLQRGSGGDRTSSSTASSRASSTSTGAPARPPVPGRASSRSAAGRARRRPARPAAATTTSSSSCASRARRSSTEALTGAPPGRWPRRPSTECHEEGPPW